MPRSRPVEPIPKKKGQKYLSCPLYDERTALKPKKHEKMEGVYIPDDLDAIVEIKQKRDNLAATKKNRIRYKKPVEPKPEPVKRQRKPAQGIWVTKRKNAR